MFSRIMLRASISLTFNLVFCNNEHEFLIKYYGLNCCLECIKINVCIYNLVNIKQQQNIGRIAWWDEI